MSIKQKKAYEYSKRVSRGNPITKDLSECAFMVGWDACLKHLAALPLDKAINEIVNDIKTNCLEKSNSSNDIEV